MKYAAMIILSAIIGMVTNYMAIKMLFHPYNEHKLFGKFRIPFTPGIIPRNRHRIAVSLAETMEENVFKEDVIINDLNANIKNTDYISEFLSKTSLNECLGDNASLTREEWSHRLSNLIINKIIDGGLIKKLVGKLYNNIAPKLGFLGAMLGNIGETIEFQLNYFLAKNGEEELSKMIEEELSKAMDHDLNLIIDKLSVNGNNFIQDIMIKASDKLLGEMIKKIDFKSIIIKQIDALDIKSFEKMILKVISKELRAITYLGGLLGGILGILNILFINIL